MSSELPVSSRRRGFSRFAALATATTLAAGAFSTVAFAAGTPSAHPIPGVSTVSPKTGLRAPQPKLDLSKVRGSASARSRADATPTPTPTQTSSGWVVPSDLVYQAFNGEVFIYGDDQPNGYSALMPSGTQQFREVVDVGNASGDGSEDILTISGSGHLQMVTANGIVSIGNGWQVYNQVTLAGDINGDGRADLIARDTSGRLWYYASTDSATAPYAPRVQVGNGWNIYDQVVGVSHFDGADASLIARDLTGKLWLYDANSDGTYGTRTQIGTGWGVYNQIVSVDLDGDGHSDLLGRTVPGVIRGYIATGAGTTAPAVQLDTGWYGLNLFADQGIGADWGKSGIEARKSNGDLYWYGTYGNGKLAAGQVEKGTGITSSLFPVLNDSVSLTNNGLSDLVGVTKYGDLWNLDSDSETPLEAGVGYTKVIGPGDLNGDGKSDLLGRSKTGTLYFIPGNGSGGVGKRVTIGGGWNIYNRLLGAGDLTDDGIPDLIATTSAGALYVYPGIGGGKFGTRIYVGGSWNIYSKLGAPGDMSGDGKGDLVGVDSAGRLWAYYGLGNGKFTARTEIGTSSWNTFTDLN